MVGFSLYRKTVFGRPIFVLKPVHNVSTLSVEMIDYFYLSLSILLLSAVYSETLITFGKQSYVTREHIEQK